MDKTLKQLGEEYLREVDLVNEKIEKCRKRLIKATREHNCDEIFIVRKLLKLFYNQKNEMMDNAKTLITYYS
ncbi:MAG: hypothetical protein E7536_08495 [Ruminococcaceae bacterium]|nr:hypothetical protein [Oscillospiraceae bacterium]